MLLQKHRKVILWIENSRGFGRDLMCGIARYASLFGPWTFYHRRSFYLDKSVSAAARKAELEHLKKWGADGIIAREFSPDTRQEVLSLDIPAILSTVYDSQLVKRASVGNIFVDNAGIGAAAAEHLLERGFRHFAFCGIDDFFWSQQRCCGFSDRLSKAGYPVLCYQSPTARKKQEWDTEQAILSRWLQSLPKPVGLMACVDERAQDVIAACKDPAIHIPEEIALVSGDNDALICELSNPQLSSVAINGEQVGYDAAQLLDALMQGKRPKDRVITVRPTHVVVRRSSDSLALPDKETALALRYIRANIRRPIQVGDVAEEVAMTRQGLNLRFRKNLGRSVHEEITRTRVQYIGRMLIETTMSISEIARQMGQMELKQLSRMFRRETGVSPLQYRKQNRLK